VNSKGGELLSQNSRRQRLGACDVTNQVERYEEECGKVITRKASQQELKEILYRFKKRKEQDENDRKCYKTEQCN